MEGRRKPVIKTYGKSSRSKTSDELEISFVSQTDNFDLLFGKKTSTIATSQTKSSESVRSRVPVIGEDPFEFAVTTAEPVVAPAVSTKKTAADIHGNAIKRTAPPAASGKPDPFAFDLDDGAATSSTKRDIAKKSKKETSRSTAQAPKITSTTTTSGFLPDNVLKVDRQLKMDAFTVSLPRLKPTAATAPVPVVSPSPAPPTVIIAASAPAPAPLPLTSTTTSMAITATTITTTAQAPLPSFPNQNDQFFSEVKSTATERKIFTTERSDRRKVANPRSWFASDDDEDEEDGKANDQKLQQKNGDSGKQTSDEYRLPRGEMQRTTSVSTSKTGVPSSITTVVDATGKRSVRVHRSEKDQYAVVRHVRGVSELQAEGSSLEYDGDYRYLIECLGASAQLSSRCLSALQLATKCAETSDFRLYLKSTGKLTEVFAKMGDSDVHDLLALCSATIFLVLSSDRSQVDLDTNSLRLLVKLVKLKPQTSDLPSSNSSSVSSSSTSQQSSKWGTAVPSQIIERVTSGVAAILKSLQRKYGADFTFSSPESPCVISEMALSGLHTLSQRCSSETMQNEFRESGALEILVEDCVCCLDEVDLSQDGAAAYAKRVKQLIPGILKLIAKNKESKRIASEYNDSCLPRALARFSCALLPKDFAKHFSVGENEARMLSQSYNLLMMLCCDAKTTCGILSSECPDFVSASVRLALIGNKSLQDVHSHFDLSILSFFVLVNIFEYSPVAAAVSHPYGSEGPSLVSVLIEFFNFLCAAAVDCEREADEQLSSSQQAKNSQSSQSEGGNKSRPQRPSSSLDSAGVSSDDTAIDAMLQAAGTRHMELNYLAACCCIVVFHAAEVEPRGVETVRKQFSGANFDVVVDVLKRFLTFTALVNGADDRTLETVAKILEKYDAVNRAAGFGLPGPSNSSQQQFGAASSSNAVASSSLNWATPPGTSGDSDSDAEKNASSDDASSDEPYAYRHERLFVAKKSRKTSGRSGGDYSEEDEDKDV